MSEIADTRQVIAVSHLPQVAAKAECHLAVAKTAKGGRVGISVARISGNARKTELARMYGLAEPQEAEQLFGKVE